MEEKSSLQTEEMSASQLMDLYKSVSVLKEEVIRNRTSRGKYTCKCITALMACLISFKE